MGSLFCVYHLVGTRKTQMMRIITD